MSDVDVESSVSVVAVTAAVGAIVLLIVLLFGIGRKTEEDKEESDDEKKDDKESPKPQKAPVKKKEKTVPRKKEKVTFTHPWLAGSLKSHNTPVTGIDFSPNGKYLASCSEDRTVLLWSVKEFAKKEHKCIRCNIEYDHATRVCFSPDSRAYVVSLGNANTLRVIKFGRKDDGSVGNFTVALDFTQGHEKEILNIGIASNGRFIMSMCKGTTIKIWDLKGECLAVVDTHQMNNSFGAVSPCGRFVACSGFTPGVKVWEVCFDKGGTFKEVCRAFELNGHSAGIHSFAFSSNSDRMATISKDGTWKLWDTNVDYKMQQDTKVLTTGQYADCEAPCVIALSPDASTVAVGSTNIHIYNAYTGDCQQVIKEPHSLPVQALGFHISGQYLVSTGDKNIYVFHNIVGYQAQITELEKKKHTATTNAHRDRLEKQIQEARLKLEELQETS